MTQDFDPEFLMKSIPVTLPWDTLKVLSIETYNTFTTHSLNFFHNFWLNVCVAFSGHDNAEQKILCLTCQVFTYFFFVQKTKNTGNGENKGWQNSSSLWRIKTELAFFVLFPPFHEEKTLKLLLNIFPTNITFRSLAQNLQKKAEIC